MSPVSSFPEHGVCEGSFRRDDCVAMWVPEPADALPAPARQLPRVSFFDALRALLAACLEGLLALCLAVLALSMGRGRWPSLPDRSLRRSNLSPVPLPAPARWPHEPPPPPHLGSCTPQCPCPGPLLAIPACRSRGAAPSSWHASLRI